MRGARPDLALTAVIVALALLVGSGPVAQAALPGDYQEFLYQGQIRIKYRQRQQGQAQTLFFIHGFGAGSHYWRDLEEHFSKNFNTIALDLKGFGYSDKPLDGNYRLSDQAALVTSFLEAKDLRQVILVGHSLGGAVALLSALQQPAGRIIGLILVDPATYGQPLPDFMKLLRLPVLGLLLPALLPPDLQVKRMLSMVFAEKTKITPAMIQQYVEYLQMPGAAAAMRETAKEIYWEDLDGVRAKTAALNLPVLIIWGDRDQVLPPDSGRRLQAEIKGAELVLIPGSGHNPHEENPAATVAAMASFLQRRLAGNGPRPTAPGF